MITPEILRLLRSPQGKEALASAQATQPGEADFLPLFQRLTRRYPSRLARAAIEQAILRQRAKAKFSRHERMFFTREALEQATPEIVALHRADRYKGSSKLFDLGCGIGGDTLALAKIAPVVAIDTDISRLVILSANAEVFELKEFITPVQADIRYPSWRYPPGSSVFFDPTRRKGTRRLRSVDAYQPPLRDFLDRYNELDALGVKISPAVDLDQISALDCEIEFVSLYGHLKEATLWFKNLKTIPRRATVLPGPYTLTGDSEPQLGVEPPRRYLYEPDPSVLRAQLVRVLGYQLGAVQIDANIAFLTSDKLFTTPFARAFEVEKVVPFGLKRLRDSLRAMDVGNVTIKKRGSAVDIVSFTRKLRLRGQQDATVILTRADNRKVAIIVKPLPPSKGLNLK